MDRFDVLLAVEYWGGTLLVISAFAAPAVFPAIAMYVSRRSEQPLVREGSVAAGFVSGFLYALLALFFAACHGVYVGDPPRQQVGIAWAEPIIVSIDRYRAARGRLPDSLGSLVPEFVSDRAMLYLPERGHFSDGPIYRADSTGYSLAFRWTGPALNDCVFTSQRRQWSCGGYF